MSSTRGWDDMSEKKLNMMGSSSPSVCWGGVSIQVPCIQRTKCLVLKKTFVKFSIEMIKSYYNMYMYLEPFPKGNFKKVKR